MADISHQEKSPKLKINPAKRNDAFRIAPNCSKVLSDTYAIGNSALYL